MGFYEYFSLLSDAGKAYFGESMGKDFPKFIDESTGIEQTELNTYWCSFAFVRADYHGKGIAKEMFRLAFEKAKAEGYPTVALATTNIVNVTIYEKIGFEQKGYKVMPSPLVDWPAWVFVKSLQDTPA
ncbi:hypothetical protein BV25DRAFT_1831901 [Artomyces pyxidatus]|uniref:Uncharacterized protein n=1 Tax=Artomyces pyxidatus TaxID=48021 RepID=A0ACB8SLQ4_9AGAM|nr:hypothetical protein BV25DRAFT_1831901 [Artomyces pyxidatus]